MFAGHTKKLFLCLIILYSNSSFCEINKNSTKKKSDIDPISLTAQRIVFKSFIKSAWNMAKIHNKATNYDSVKYKLGQIASDLIIDEALPSENKNKIQEISESLVPIIISECIIFQYKNSLQEKNTENVKQNIPTLVIEILKKLAEKTVKANFFLDKEYKYYNLSKNLTTYPFVFFNTKTFKLTDLKSCEPIHLQTGTKNIINEAVKIIIASEQINLGKVLNKKQRKKAIAKAINAILDPYINELFK